ncbi:MAG TPA: hypothetical protein VLC72_03490 [Nitrosopumilaceae archaeon]|nr:hypothetical protein [Nitrosopumilaceae archaeon]
MGKQSKNIMVKTQLAGSGGYVTADISDEQQKKADLGVGKLFLMPLGKIDESKISNFFCKKCNAEFAEAPKLKIENPNEELGQGITLKTIGQYLCTKCNSIIGEYREFSKNE